MVYVRIVFFELGFKWSFPDMLGLGDFVWSLPDTCLEVNECNVGDCDIANKLHLQETTRKNTRASRNRTTTFALVSEHVSRNQEAFHPHHPFTTS